MAAVGCSAFATVAWLVASRIGRKNGKLPARDGYLSLVVGLRRHGKTLFVCRLIHDRLSAGLPVYANFTVSGGAHKMESWRDVILAPRGSVVVLDECSQWCGSRAGSTMRPAARWYIAQFGKLEHEVYLIAQHESQVAGEVVAQVNEIIECKRMPKQRHRATSYAPQDFRKKDARPQWAWWYDRKGGAVTVYNTLDLVPPERTRKQSHDDDIEMIEECIEIILARRNEPDAAAIADAWLEAADEIMAGLKS